MCSNSLRAHNNTTSLCPLYHHLKYHTQLQSGSQLDNGVGYFSLTTSHRRPHNRPSCLGVTCCVLWPMESQEKAKPWSRIWTVKMHFFLNFEGKNHQEILAIQTNPLVHRQIDIQTVSTKNFRHIIQIFLGVKIYPKLPHITRVNPFISMTTPGMPARRSVSLSSSTQSIVLASPLAPVHLWLTWRPSYDYIQVPIEPVTTPKKTTAVPLKWPPVVRVLPASPSQPQPLFPWSLWLSLCGSK